MENHTMTTPPRFSPWGEVQVWKELCPGVFSVSTASHGGIVASMERAEQIFSVPALQCAFAENGLCCFEEDCAAAIAIRELMDKGLFTAPVNKYFAAGKYERIINDTVQRYFPRYWAARETALAKKDISEPVFPSVKRTREYDAR